MAVALSKRGNAIFRTQIYSQNREARDAHLMSDEYLRLLYYYSVAYSV